MPKKPRAKVVKKRKPTKTKPVKIKNLSKLLKILKS